MAEIGYYQLYFLLVIMQFYLVFPFVLMLLRRTRGHHGLVIAVAAAAQIAITICGHWDLLPALMERYDQQDALSYLLYLIGGSVVAFHLDEVHDWVCGHARLIVALTVAAALAAEGIYFLALHGVTTVLGSGSDFLQPSVIPFNIGAIACGYLAGVALARPSRSRWAKAGVRAGVDDAFGIYLSQMVFITALVWLGWGRLSSVVPWPLLCAASVAIIFGCCIALTAVLARTPLAVPLTGRKQAPWPSLWSRPRPGAAHSAATDRSQSRRLAAGHDRLVGDRDRAAAGHGRPTTRNRPVPARGRRAGGRGLPQERSVTLIRQWIDSAAAHWGGAAYLQDAGGAGQLTFADLQHATRAWERCLDRAGLPPGARVAVRLADPVEYACALVAIIGAGRVVVPLDPAAPAAALATVLDVARPEAIVAHGGSGLPPGLPVLPPPGPGEEDRPAGHGRDPADWRDFPVHQRHQRHAQGGPAA